MKKLALLICLIAFGAQAQVTIEGWNMGDGHWSTTTITPAEAGSYDYETWDTRGNMDFGTITVPPTYDRQDFDGFGGADYGGDYGDY